MHPAAPSSFSVRLPCRCALIVAALSLLMMPVDYRGGAEDSHPHGVFQLLEEATHGSLDHHHAAHSASYHLNDDDYQARPLNTSAHAQPDLPRLSDGAGSSQVQSMVIALGAATLLFNPVGHGLPLTGGRRLHGRGVEPSLPPPRVALAA